MKLLHTQTITDLASRFLLPEGKYRGIYIAFDGTNQAAQTLATTDGGVIRMLVDGKEKHRIDFDLLHDIINLEYGVCEESSVAGDAFRLIAYLPFHLPEDDDVCYTVAADKKVEIIHQYPNGTSTIVASGTVVYYGLLADDTVPTPYELRWMNHHLSIGAAGVTPHKVYADNIYKLYFENETQLTSLGIIKDGESAVDTIDKDNLYAISQILRRIETFSASTPVFDINLAGSSEDVAAQNDDVTLHVNAAAACTLNMVVLSIDITPKKLSASLVRRNLALRRKVIRKQRKGVSTKVIDYINRSQV